MDTKEMRQTLRDAGQHVPRSNKDLEAAYKLYTGEQTTAGVIAEKILNEAFEKDVTSDSVAALGPTSSENSNAPTLDVALRPVVKLVSTNEWTYIGSGDEPPHMINFMGMQKFVRGQPTPVSDPYVIEKISNHKCFVKGKVDQKILFENDEQAKKEAQDQRDEDVTTEIMSARANRGK